MRAPRFPSYPKKQHASGQARIVLEGESIYLGPHGSRESREKYERLRGERARGGTPAGVPPTAPPVHTVEDLVARFWVHAKSHYRDADGRPSSEIESYRQTLRPLLALYGQTPVTAFGPRALKELRQAMIDGSWLPEAGRRTLARRTANQRIGKIKRVWKWAAGEELVGPELYQRLAAVAGLQRGRAAARECADVPPVPDEVVDATLPHLGRVVGAMVRLQRLTGMRPGEVCRLSPGEVDRGGPSVDGVTVWVYRPGRHKTMYLGKRRQVVIGPRAQAVLAPFLERPAGAHCFSPAESLADFHHGRTAARVSRRSRARPGAIYHATRPHFTVRAYRARIERAARMAARQTGRSVPAWSPNQLRHAAATAIQRAAGLDAARAVLGHDDPRTTTIYAERDLRTAAEVIARIG